MPPTAQIQIVAGTTGLQSGLRTAAGMIRGFAASAGQQVRNAISTPRRLMGLASDFAAIGLAMRGLDRLASQGKSFMEFDAALTQFGIAQRSTPAELQEIAKAARSTSTAVGLDAREVLAAGKAYVDLAGAQNFSIAKMKILAESARASGSDTKDMAGMMYQLTRSMKVADNQMEDTIGGLINQAKDGAIEAAQMSREFAGMMPIFARFGVTGREGAIQLGAMYQVTRDGFDTAAQAATGLTRLMVGMLGHASKFEKAGVHIFKPGSKSELRTISDIMDQISKSPLAHDTEALRKAFGRTEGWRSFALIAESIPRLRELEAAGRANGVVQRDLATVAESASGRMSMAIEKVKNSIADAFTKDRLDGFLSALDAAADKVGAIMKMVGGVADMLGVVYRAGQAIRGFISSNENNNPFKDEADRLEEARKRDKEWENEPGWKKRSFTKTGGTDAMTAQQIAVGERAIANRKAYDLAVWQITKAEGGTEKATEESIRQAVMASRANRQKPGGLGESVAGDRYLALSGMPKARIDEIVKAMDERSASVVLKPFVDALGDRIELAIKTMGMPSAQHQAIALQRAIHAGVGSVPWRQPMVKVNFDGNEAKRSTANATDARRK